MMDLDTRRYQIKKENCESLDTKFNERFAKFQNIENAMRNHSQYPATGFHAVVTKKFDQSLAKNSGVKQMSKAIGSIQSMESLKSIQSNRLFNDKSIVSDYQNINLKKGRFETKAPNFLKNATNISSL